MQEQYTQVSNQSFDSMLPPREPKKSKGWLVLVVVVAVLILLAAAFYFFIFDKSPPDEEPQLDQTQDPLPVLLLGQRTISPILSFDGETVWFVNSEGKMFRLRTDGSALKEEYLLPASPATSQGGPALSFKISRVIWERDGSDFILEYLSNGHTRYKYYDSSALSFVEYPSQIREINFLPGGSGIVYDWVTATTTHELKVSLPSGDGFSTVSGLFRPDYQIAASPIEQKVVLFRDDMSDPANLILVDLQTAKFTDLDEEAEYQGVKFSFDGKQLIAVKAGSLVLYDMITLEQQILKDGVENVGRAAWEIGSEEIVVGDEGGFVVYNIVNRQWRDLYKFPKNNTFLPNEIIFDAKNSRLLFVDEPTGYLYKVDLE